METSGSRVNSFRFAWQLAAADFIIWTLAVPLAVVLRFDFTLPASLAEVAFVAGLVTAALYVGSASLLRMYSGRYVSGTFDEVVGIGLLVGLISTMGTAVLVFAPPSLPRATEVIAGGISLFAILGVRFTLRRFRVLRSLSRTGNRTLIYGAGEAGSQLATLMQSDRGSRFIPVGFIDDDPGKRHLRRSNIRVLGSGENIEHLLRETQAETLVIAIAGVSSSRLQEIDRICAGLGVRVQVIPTTSEILGGAIRLGDVSDLSEEDIMGRRAVSTNESQISEYLRGRSVLVTGAGGSIGAEIARQVHRYAPARVMLLDRDESALLDAQLSIDGSGLLASEDLILADIRDSAAIDQVFARYKPDIVFHAAALKHLTFLERFPREAWKTNVEGTRNVLSSSLRNGVQGFVNISTDKAADPTSVLGMSKRITERMVAALSPRPGSWVSVRFGNVLGSRGSVVTTFRHQIANGGPVTVTHPEVTRYFMTVREAVHLVLQASVLGVSGETLILDMGEPKRVADIARFMVDRSNREIPIVFTGLRPGEKLHEVLISEGEHAVAPKHPLVFHTHVEPLGSLTMETPPNDEVAREIFLHLAREGSDSTPR